MIFGNVAFRCAFAFSLCHLKPPACTQLNDFLCSHAAFHEAVGDAVTLSVSTPKHLQTLGLIQKSVDDTAHNINYLFALALEKVVFLPFALTLDRWRWDIFDRHIGKEQYNCHYWLLRERYGGIKPPVLRSEMDFDPGAKYHVPANIPYIR